MLKESGAAGVRGTLQGPTNYGTPVHYTDFGLGFNSRNERLGRFLEGVRRLIGDGPVLVGTCSTEGGRSRCPPGFREFLGIVGEVSL